MYGKEERRVYFDQLKIQMLNIYHINERHQLQYTVTSPIWNTAFWSLISGNLGCMSAVTYGPGIRI